MPTHLNDFFNNADRFANSPPRRWGWTFSRTSQFLYLIDNSKPLPADIVTPMSITGTERPAAEAALTAHPNPFNPAVSFKYQVASHNNVRLSVYNMKGQLIRTLVDGPKTPGRHTVTWEAENQSSGTYLIEFRSGKSVNIKKIHLIK